MMNLVIRVEVALIVHVKITAAVGPSIVFALEIGCVPSQLQGSRLMFCLAIVHTVLIQLLSKRILESKAVIQSQPHLHSLASGFIPPL
ncbi:hypothetical protein H5410_014326 [Solanum commersonii]|uniref:Uncharacterized protein n=1 Tax=Solanum commersonii TaxID=4109 RepID=A0A9J5ZQN2_SOLCO|nr:hypothetical protein H5410_014326 [Solanum commersonii]